MSQFVLNPSTLYAQTSKALYETSTKSERVSYESLSAMLSECYLVGSTRFGKNFIA